MNNPHDIKLKHSWDSLKIGLRLYLKNDDNRNTTYFWLCNMYVKTGIIYYNEWINILLLKEYLDILYKEYVELSDDRKEYWRPFIQTPPFVPLIRNLIRNL